MYSVNPELKYGIMVNIEDSKIEVVCKSIWTVTAWTTQYFRNPVESAIFLDLYKFSYACLAGVVTVFCSGIIVYSIIFWCKTASMQGTTYFLEFLSETMLIIMSIFYVLMSTMICMSYDASELQKALTVIWFTYVLVFMPTGAFMTTKSHLTGKHGNVPPPPMPITHSPMY